MFTVSTIKHRKIKKVYICFIIEIMMLLIVCYFVSDKTLNVFRIELMLKSCKRFQVLGLYKTNFIEVL